MNSIFWTDETIERLRTLWDEGLSAAAIARRLGTSKNSVVGKSHRLDLPPRPSPIIRDGRPRVATPRVHVERRPKETLQTLASTRTVSPPRQPAPPRYGRSMGCCWPEGEPRTPSFRFCDDPSVPGKPYCADHYARAYIKLPKLVVDPDGPDTTDYRVPGGWRYIKRNEPAA